MRLSSSISIPKDAAFFSMTVILFRITEGVKKLARITAHPSQLPNVFINRMSHKKGYSLTGVGKAVNKGG